MAKLEVTGQRRRLGADSILVTRLFDFLGGSETEMATRVD